MYIIHTDFYILCFIGHYSKKKKKKKQIIQNELFVSIVMSQRTSNNFELN